MRNRCTYYEHVTVHTYSSELYSFFPVDLATSDPTSDETERSSSTMVRTLVDAYKTSRTESSLVCSGSEDRKKEDVNKEQWPVLAMFRNLEHQPGSLKQFWILYRYLCLCCELKY